MRFIGGIGSRNHPIPIAFIWSSMSNPILLQDPFGYGKPNGNKKREGTAFTLGRRRSKKRRLTLLKAIGGEECLPSSKRRGKGATYLTNNKKGGDIGDR